MKGEMHAQARVRACACARARVHGCGTGMTQIRRLFWLGVSVLLLLAELFLHTAFSGSGALQASQLLPILVLEGVDLVSLELVGSELACARLACVCLQVIGVKALCTASLAN